MLGIFLPNPLTEIITCPLQKGKTSRIFVPAGRSFLNDVSGFTYNDITSTLQAKTIPDGTIRQNTHTINRDQPTRLHLVYFHTNAHSTLSVFMAGINIKESEAFDVLGLVDVRWTHLSCVKFSGVLVFLNCVRDSYVD